MLKAKTIKTQIGSWRVWATAAMAVIFMGCSSTEPRGRRSAERATAGQASMRLSGVRPDDVAPVAERVFRQYFSIDREKSAPGSYVSRPLEDRDLARATGIRGSVSGAHVRQRRTARLDLLREGANTLVRCNVRIERMEAVERVAFARQQGDDRPTDTPIDRAGSGGVGSRQEWVAAGRDRDIEQQILRGIEQELEAGSQPAN